MPRPAVGRWQAFRAGWSAWLERGRNRWRLLVAVFAAIRLVARSALALWRSLGRFRRAGARLFGRRA